MARVRGKVGHAARRAGDAKQWGKDGRSGGGYGL